MTSSLRVALAATALSSALFLSVGCTARSGGDRDAGPGGGDFDAGRGMMLPDGAIWFPDGAVNSCAAGCGPVEICGSEGATVGGNGVNDDCDMRVDEGCTCTPGDAHPCFTGSPDRRNVGQCADGIETCTEFGVWSSCSDVAAGTIPTPETCDGTDNDCSGIADEGLSGCTSAVTCPGNEQARPLSNHTLRGARVTPGGTNWSWGIECPDSVPAMLCPRLATPNAENTDVYFSASGAYRVTVTFRNADGSNGSCAWTVYVAGGGLRVELNWDTMLDTEGGTDVDLHLHRWTRAGVDTNFFEDTDDCYYGNCTPEYDYSWPMHPTSALENCQDAPHGGGDTWRAAGHCGNPRLDADTNGTDGACTATQTDPNQDDFCAPENINVDDPVLGMPYRIMVNYYSDSGASSRPTYPRVSVYCGGALRGSFGVDPIITLDDGEGNGAENDNWYVADVVFFEGTCGLDCMVYPIGTVVQGMTDPSDPFGFSSIAPFGPPWECTYNASAGTCTP